MKISHKLMLNTGVLIVFLLGVGYIYNSTNTKLETTHKALLEEELEEELKALEVESKMLEARRNEKDFLMRLDLDYVEKHKNTMQKLRHLTKSIKSIATKTDNKKIVDLVTVIDEKATDYEKTFVAVKDLWVKRGLDHKSGIQGKFRTLIKGMEAEFKAYQTERIYLDLLQMRRYEKDYQRTIGQEKNSKYFTKLNIAIDNFLKNRAEISFSDENAKLITSLVEGYKQAFKIYNDAIASGNKSLQEKEYDNIRHAAHDIEGFIKANYIPDVSAQLLTIRRKEKDYLLRYSNDDAARKYSRENHEAVTQLLTSISNSDLSAEKKTEFEKLLNSYSSMFTSLTEVDISIKESVAVMRKAVQSIEPLLRGTEEVPGMTRIARSMAEAKTAAIKVQAEDSNGFAKFLTFFAAVLGLGLSVVINKSLNSPLQKVLESTKRLASKDLTVRLELNRNDELGEMAASLDGAISNLNGQMQTIQSNSSTLKTSVDHIGDSAQEISNSMVAASEDASMVESVSDTMSKNMEKVSKETEMLSEQSMEVSMKATEIADTMNSVAAVTEESQINISTIAASSEQMSSSINEIAENTERCRGITTSAVSSVQSANDKVNELAMASAKIENIINVIVEISEQTKNLALNATIESARAGEAGKGFAVVANEVKELAKQTSDATVEIRESIMQMSACSESTVSEISNISGVINEVDGIVNSIASAIEEQSITIRDNTENINQAASGLLEVSKNISNTSMNTNEIVEVINSFNDKIKFIAEESETTKMESLGVLDSIKSIKSVVEMTQKSTEAFVSSSAELNNLADGMNTLINEFSLDVEENGNDTLVEVDPEDLPKSDEDEVEEKAS